MVQVIPATFKDGVFQPDHRPELADSARVRLLVEPLGTDDESRRAESWKILEGLWSSSRFNSTGARLNRDQLHERR